MYPSGAGECDDPIRANAAPGVLPTIRYHAAGTWRTATVMAPGLIGRQGRLANSTGHDPHGRTENLPDRLSAIERLSCRQRSASRRGWGAASPCRNGTVDYRNREIVGTGLWGNFGTVSARSDHAAAGRSLQWRAAGRSPYSTANGGAVTVPGARQIASLGAPRTGDLGWSDGPETEPTWARRTGSPGRSGTASRERIIGNLGRSRFRQRQHRTPNRCGGPSRGSEPGSRHSGAVKGAPIRPDALQQARSVNLRDLKRVAVSSHSGGANRQTRLSDLKDHVTAGQVVARLFRNGHLHTHVDRLVTR